MLSEVKYGKQIEGEVIDFTMMECGGCGIPYYVPTRWYKAKVNEHGSFKCPNGCSLVFTAKTDAEKIQDQLTIERKRAAEENENLSNRLLDEMNKKRKLELQLKRVHKGVCPCCNRSFQNLAAHMKTKHPETVKK